MQLIRSVLYPAVACVLSIAATTSLNAQVDSTAKTDSSKIIVNMDQAVRGMAGFKKTCVECHTKSDVSGADFKAKWHGRSPWELYDVIKTTMPDDKPGSLTPDEYVDIVAYLIRLNGAPNGGAAFVPTDTAGLKKGKMEILVPSPMIDSGRYSARLQSAPAQSAPAQSAPAGNSTAAHNAVYNLLSRQSNKR